MSISCRPVCMVHCEKNSDDLAMHSGWIIYEWGKYGVNISYQFVVYIHGYLFSCITAVLTNHSSWSSSLL